MKLTKDNLEKCAPKNIQDPLFSFIVFVNGKFTQSDILSERGVLTNGVDYIPIPVYLRSFQGGFGQAGAEGGGSKGVV